VGATAATASTFAAASAVIAFSASVVLVAGGVAKTLRPAGTERALSAAHLPSGAGIVRTLGSAEAAIGVAFLVAPGRTTGALVAGAYLAFAAFIMYLLLGRVAVASCGCAGERDLPPSWLHVVLDGIAAAGASAVLVAPEPPRAVWSFAAGQLAGVPFLFGLALVAWLAVMVVAYVPTMFGSYRGRMPA
jgi:hypothetical protein